MRIIRLDTSDRDHVRHVYDVVVAAKSHERPHFQPSPFDQVAAALAHVEVGEERRDWVGYDGDEPVVAGTLWLTTQDNVDVAYVDLETVPHRRREGFASALLEVMLDTARKHGRTRAVGDIMVPADRLADHPYRRFVERHGFEHGNNELIQIAPLPIADEVLDRLERQARAGYEGDYRIETYDRVPDDLVPSLGVLMGRVATDAPSGSLDWEEEVYSPERYASMLAGDAKAGRRRYTSLAVHEASGAVVAYTELMVNEGMTRVHQAGTLVHAEHRGHRLGLAVKVANIRRVQREHPERTDMLTGNAVANEWMVAINAQLGFVPVEYAVGFQRPL